MCKLQSYGYIFDFFVNNNVAEYNTLRQKKTAYYYDNTVRFIYFQYTFGIKIQNRKIMEFITYNLTLNLKIIWLLSSHMRSQ